MQSDFLQIPFMERVLNDCWTTFNAIETIWNLNMSNV